MNIAIHEGIPQRPTPEFRLEHLNKVCSELRQSCNRDLMMLEIGSLFGASTKILAQHGHVVCVDPWTFGMKEFLENTKELRVTPVRGYSESVLPFLRSCAFDLVYVDGDHHYHSALSDLGHAIRLVTSNGVVCGDDLERVIGRDITLEKVQEDMDDHPRAEYHKTYHAGVTLAVSQMLPLQDLQVRDGFYWVKL